jgi:hypothetical protein
MGVHYRTLLLLRHCVSSQTLIQTPETVNPGELSEEDQIPFLAFAISQDVNLRIIRIAGAFVFSSMAYDLIPPNI